MTRNRPIECQLTMNQIERYMGGHPVSDETMQALEEHLAECELCRRTVESQRNQLESPEPEVPTHAVVEIPEPVVAKPTSLANRVVTMIPGQVRTVTLSITLVVVLTGMSAIARNPSSVFGPKLADDPKKVVASDVERAKPAPKPQTKPVSLPKVTPAPKPAVTETPKATPKKTPALAPIPKKTVRPITTRRVKRTVRSKPAPQPRVRPKATPKPAPPSSGIRVYDAQGNLIR